MKDKPLLPEIVTRPLEDDPVTRGYVMERLQELQHRARAGPDYNSPEQIAEVLANTEAGSSSVTRRRIIIEISAILLVVLAVVAELWQALPSLAESSRYPTLQRLANEKLHRMVSDDAFFDPSWRDEEELLAGIRKAWEKHPNSPEYYYYYSNIFSRFGPGLPADFAETTTRLDPDNGVWDLLRAQYLAFKSIDKRSKSKTPDPELLAASMEAVRSAERKPRLDGYGAKIKEIYGRSYSPSSMAEREQLIFFFEDSNESLIHPAPFDLRIPIQPELRRIEADPAACSDLLKLAKKLLIRSILAGEPPPGEAENLERWASTHGMRDEARQFSHLVDLAEEVNLRQPASDPVWTPSTVVYFSRLVMLPAAVTLLLFSGLVRLRGLPKKGVVNRVASCFAPLLRVSSRQVATLSFALVLVAAVLGGIISMNFEPDWVLQLGPLLALTGVALILQLIRHQMSRALGSLGLQASLLQKLMGYLAVGCTIAALGSRLIGTNEALAAAIGAVLLYLTVQIIVGYTGFASSLRHCLFARSLVSSLSIMAGILATCSLLLHPVESLLVKRDWQAYHAKLSERTEAFLTAHRDELQGMLRKLE